MARRRVVASSSRMPDSLAWGNWAEFLDLDAPAPENSSGVLRSGQNLAQWRKLEASRRLREARTRYLAAQETRPGGVSDWDWLHAHGLNFTHRGTPAARAIGV